MTHPRSPSAGELIDIMVVDAEIEALRRGIDQADDPASQLLLELRDRVDNRAAAILGAAGSGPERRDTDAPDAEPSLGHAAHAGRSPEPYRLSRRARIAVIPLTGVLVLGSTGVAAALSRSPHTPLYGLHRFIFGAAPSSDSQLARDLAGASAALDRAAALAPSARGASLSQARLLLTEARQLLPRVSTSSLRRGLQGQLDREVSRLAALARPAAPATPSTPSTPSAKPPAASPEPAPSAPAAAPAAPPVRTGGEASPAGAAEGAETDAAGTESAPAAEAPEVPTAPLPPAKVSTENDDPVTAATPASGREQESEGAEGPDN